MSNTIRAYAVMQAGEALQAYQFDAGELQAHQVEVKVEYCGLCHSDLSVIQNDWHSSVYPVVAGHENERGSGKGFMYNHNFPMPHGSSEQVFMDNVDKALDVVRTFAPDVVVHVLGFDVYVDDPQAKCAVSTQGFTELAAKIRSLGIPTMVLVEGGYLVEKLEDNLDAFIQGFAHPKA